MDTRPAVQNEGRPRVASGPVAGPSPEALTMGDGQRQSPEVQGSHLCWGAGGDSGP